MLPAPASTASPPRPASRLSWNPAVPPPPVAGATVMKGLGEGLAAAVPVCTGEGDALGEGLGGALGERLGEGLGEALTVRLRDGVGVPSGVGEPDWPGENDVWAPALGVPVEQAETSADVKMVMVVQPMTANLALRRGRALAAGTLMTPPRAAWPVLNLSATRHQKRASGEERAARWPLPGPAGAISAKRQPGRGRPERHRPMMI
jgi:hypothetical protein